MKNLTMTVAALMAFMSAAFASGNDSNSKRATVVAIKGQIFKVLYTDKEPSLVTIRLKDEEGHLIRTDRIRNKKGFMKPYKMKDMKEGTYYFEFKDQYGTMTEKVELANEHNNLMAVNTLDKKRYRVLVEQKEVDPLNLTIFNSDGVVLHSEKIQYLKEFSKVYDLSGIRKEGFVFQLKDKSSTRIVSVD